MLDYNSLVLDYSRKYRFERVTSTAFRIYDLEHTEKNKPEYIVIESSTGGLVDTAFLPIDADIAEAFEAFKTSPEYMIGLPVTIGGQSLEDLRLVYETLLAGITIIKIHNQLVNSEQIKKRIATVLDWLAGTDFYTAPASTIYHGSFVGGLLIHSLEVYNQIISLHKLPQFNDVSFSSAALVALTHDWCKIGMYESYDKNVKNQTTGQWEQVKAFRRNQIGVPLGHGAASMFLAQRLFPSLEVDEALAIRWHQSRWNVCEPEQNEFQLANETCPLVHLLQFADQLSITKYANLALN